MVCHKYTKHIEKLLFNASIGALAFFYNSIVKESTFSGRKAGGKSNNGGGEDVTLAQLLESPSLSTLASALTLTGNTGCSLNIVFFPKILKYSGLLPFNVFPAVSVCVHTPGR